MDQHYPDTGMYSPRVDPDQRDKFHDVCRKKGKTASEVIREYIDWVLEGNNCGLEGGRKPNKLPYSSRKPLGFWMSKKKYEKLNVYLKERDVSFADLINHILNIYVSDLPADYVPQYVPTKPKRLDVEHEAMVARRERRIEKGQASMKVRSLRNFYYDD